MTVENRWLVLSVLCFVMGMLVFAGVQRYPVGQPAPASVYTEPFDPCDPIYKFIQINYGEPNKPKWQAAPDDWILKFGNNERTMLLHSISELRVVAAAQSKRILALEQKQKPYNEADLERIYKDEPALLGLAKDLYGYHKDPNAGSTSSPQEAKP